MLKVLGGGATLCDGIKRRELLVAGGLSLLGMNMPSVLRAAEQSSARPGKAKSVILFNLLGGPSHIDMFDMKPDAPAEIRGEFKPISTSLPGLQICEHLPNVAKWMHKSTLVRTISHTHDSHNPMPILSGYTEGDPAQLSPSSKDPPDIGAICQYMGLGPADVPGAVCLPCYPGAGAGYRRPGPYGGFLGSQYDPMFAMCDPKFDREPSPRDYDPVMPIGEPFLPGLDTQPEMTVERFDKRLSLLSQIDDAFRKNYVSNAQKRLDKFQQRATDLLTSGKTRKAFDLSQESAETKDRYGRNLYGSSMLLARRLVEAGVSFVSVHQDIFRHYGHSYDMHENNFGMLKNFNLPILDKVYPALIQDLEDRGLLESTLVIVMGEMGRAPKINGRAGRDHWPRCGFCLLTGGGVKEGHIYGATDKHGAYPTKDAVHPSALVATVYELLGIDPHMMVHDVIGRPYPIARGGSPVQGIIA